MHSVEKEFESNGMKTPEYLKPGPENLSSSRKTFVNKDLVNDLISLHQFRKSPKYDAFEKDIAIANLMDLCLKEVKIDKERFGQLYSVMNKVFEIPNIKKYLADCLKQLKVKLALFFL